MPMLNRSLSVSVISASTMKLPEYMKLNPRTSPDVSLGRPMQTAANRQTQQSRRQHNPLYRPTIVCCLCCIRQVRTYRIHNY
jgi:hypothetical protein